MSEANMGPKNGQEYSFRGNEYSCPFLRSHCRGAENRTRTSRTRSVYTTTILRPDGGYDSIFHDRFANWRLFCGVATLFIIPVAPRRTAASYKIIVAALLDFVVPLYHSRELFLLKADKAGLVLLRRRLRLWSCRSRWRRHWHRYKLCCRWLVLWRHQLARLGWFDHPYRYFNRI